MFNESPNISYLLNMANELLDHYDTKVPSFFRTKFPKCYDHLSARKFKILEPAKISTKIASLKELSVWEIDAWPGETRVKVLRLSDDRYAIMGENVISGDKVLDWAVNNELDTKASFYAISMKTFFDHEMYL